jgi:hypothetical protein
MASRVALSDDCELDFVIQCGENISNSALYLYNFLDKKRSV